MLFGMSDEHWSIVNSLVVAPLKSVGARVFVFGSRATGVHHTFSDLDMVYVTPLNTELDSDLLARIRGDIEDSDLPIKLDLVSRSEIAPSYLPRIDSECVEI